MTTIAHSTPVNDVVAGPPMMPAQVDRRLLAGLIDLAAGAALWLVVVLALRQAGTVSTLVMILLALAVAVPRELVLAVTGASLGGLLTDVRFIDATTAGPPARRLAPHAGLVLVSLVLTLGLGAIPMMRSAARDPLRQTWPDRVAGLRAVVGGPRALTAGELAPEYLAPAPSADTPVPPPARESVFPEDRRLVFSPGRSSPGVNHTFDTGIDVSIEARVHRAVIDSVPWSSVPTRVDPPTLESPITPGTSEPSWQNRPASPSAPWRSDPGAGPRDLATAAAASPVAPAAAAASPITPAAVPAPVGGGAPPSILVPEVVPSPVMGTASPTSSTAPPRPAASAARLSSGSAAATASPAAGADRPVARVTRMSRRRAAASGPKVRLTPLAGGESIPLSGPVVVGRDPQNISDYPEAGRVTLADATRSISKTHAAVAPVSGGAWITDLHSTNGTRVEHDGGVQAAEPSVPIPVSAGSIVFFGRAAYRLES